MALSGRPNRRGSESMSGTSIFQKQNGAVNYYDQIAIGEYFFEVNVRVRERRGDPSAIHCGRIVVFEMMCDGELVGYFDDGQWYITPDCPPYEQGTFEESAIMARDLMITKWSNPERIRMKIEKTDLF